MNLSIERRISNPIMREILIGVYDDGSPFFKLQGMWHILQHIWNNVKSLWRKQIQYCDVYESTFRRIVYLNQDDPWERVPVPVVTWGKGNLAYVPIPSVDNGVTFPEPKYININMMPFILSDDFEKAQLPNYLKTYWENIIKYCKISKDEIGKIGFLTIQESLISENESQNRPGIHVGTHGNDKIRLKTDCCDVASKHGHYVDKLVMEFSQYSMLNLEGGIFMASTVDHSCKMWNCRIIAEENGDEIIGPLGDVEHLRELLNDHENMKPNHIYWLTDRTPHESLPLSKGTFRQFFRLDTSNVSFWYEDRFTKNPLGVEPDPKTTVIIEGSQFNDGQHLCERCNRLLPLKSNQETCTDQETVAVSDWLYDRADFK